MKLEDQPLISVIITTKNEERNIETLLKSVQDQTYKHYEIILVDNHSTDQTLKITGKYTSSMFTKGPERSTQRNFGVEKARGDYVLILDADMKLEREVLLACVKKTKKGFEAIIIPELSYGTGFLAQCKALEKKCYVGDDTIEAARFFSKAQYLKLGGFDVSLVSGEDWDLTHRARQEGLKVGRIQAYIHHHEWNLTLSDTLRKKYYYGQKIQLYQKKNPAGFKKQARLFRPAFIRNWKLLIKHPLYTVGMFFLKTAEFSAAGLGLLKSKIYKKN